MSLSSRGALLLAALGCMAAVQATWTRPVAAQEQESPAETPAPQAPPDAPTGLDVFAQGVTAKISWRSSAGATSYRVERARGEGEDFAPVVEVKPAKEGEPPETKAEDPSLEIGASYRYRVVALNAAGASEPSSVEELQTLRPPSEVRASLAVIDSDTHEAEVTLTWTDAEPERSDKFTIERARHGSGQWEKLDDLRKSRKDKKSGKADFEFFDDAIDPETAYDYRVVAREKLTESPPSAVARTAPRGAPRAPRDLRVGAFSTEVAQLRWRDVSRNEDGYLVERRRPGSEEWTELARLPADATSYSAAVQPGEAWEYRVRALNSRGEAASPVVGGRAPRRDAAPLGVVGPSGVTRGPTGVTRTAQATPDAWRENFSALPDRWRITFPEWDRYPEQLVDPEEKPYEEGSWLNPYTQSVIKGDYPVLGNDIFFNLELQSDTLAEGRAFPIPSGVSTAEPSDPQFFGDFDQFLFNQNFVISAELFQGDTAFRPKDFAVKLTGVGNINYLKAFEDNLVDIDVREGEDRVDGVFALQEALIDKHLVDLGSSYDFITLIAGVQRFQSDFRGFNFFDNNLGVRLQTNYLSNRLQLNLAWFHQLEKDTNSGLNTFDLRPQHVFVANLYFQDVFKELGRALTGHDVLGYTLLLNYHYNLDQRSTEYDDNGFLVRPTKIGAATSSFGPPNEKELRIHYLGWGGEGHIGPLNISHQYYLAWGQESFNEISGEKQDVLAHFFALELSVDVDWLRFKGSYLYASGDPNPTNGRASGFSAIFDNPFFAGSGFSYFNRQNVPLVQTGAQLTNRLSLLPDLRSSKTQGQSNFVNPGLHLFNVGMSARVTPKLFVDFNVNFLYFDNTAPLELVLVQGDIDRSIGVDYNVGVQYRPFLTDNVIVTAGAGALVPGEGFRAIYSAKTLYSGFLALTLTY